MLTLIKEEYKPDSGSWPIMVYKEYEFKDRPGIVACLSYYKGFDVNPLASLHVEDRTVPKGHPSSLSLPSPKFDDGSVPTEAEVRAYLAIAIG